MEDSHCLLDFRISDGRSYDNHTVFGHIPALTACDDLRRLHLFKESKSFISSSLLL